MPRTILIPTDFSPCSVYSIQWAAKNLFQNKDNVILLHIVSDEPIIIDSEIGCIAEDDSEVNKNVALSKKSAEKWRKSLTTQLAPSLNLTVTSKVVTGSAGPTTVEEIKEVNPDFVLVGTHNRSSMSEFFMGSVSKYVLQHSNKPVVVVHQNQ